MTSKDRAKLIKYKGIKNVELMGIPGNTNERGRLSTVYLLIKVACFVTKVNNIFSIKIR